MNIRIETDKYFSLKSTFYSHGWIDLLPFHLNVENQRLHYSFSLNPSEDLSISFKFDSETEIYVYYDYDLDEQNKNQLISKVKRMFRLDEDFGEFYDIVKTENDFKWIFEKGAGRLLRSANLWEDMVKMLCTTNCTWRLTQIMTENLFEILGNSKSFPSAKIVAQTDEQFLREKIKMGYRAPYLLEFAQLVVEEKLDLDKFDNWQSDSISLYKEIRKIKGFGDYAVSSLMKLLGRYDYMGFDSWNRKQFYNKHKKGKECPDIQITKFYKKFGKWAGLFFWLDVTKDWYFKEKPWE